MGTDHRPRSTVNPAWVRPLVGCGYGADRCGAGVTVGLFTESYVPQVNGVANTVQLLKRGLEERGHVAHVFAPRLAGHVDVEPNVHRLPQLASFRPIEKLLKFELDWQIPSPALGRHRKVLETLDIIHTHHMFVIGLAAARYGKRKRIPTVFTNHTNYGQFDAIIRSGGLFGLAVRRWFGLVSGLTAGFVTPGRRMTAQLRQFGVRSDITAIPNAVDLSKFGVRRDRLVEELRNRHSIGAAQRVLLYVGRLSREKNLLFLLESLAPLLRETADLRMMFVGDGKQRAQLERASRSLGVSDRTVFTGYVPYEQVHDYFYMGDIFVTASLSEVFPLTVIEGLAASLPVVAIDAVGTGDIVADGYNGLLVAEDAEAFRQATQQLLRDDGLRAELGINAAESVSRLSVASCVESHLSLYRKYAAGA